MVRQGRWPVHKFMFMALGALFATGVGGCTDDDPDGRIVGGSLADPDEYPFMASLQEHVDESAPATPSVATHRCGGALVAPDLVLTAAHCVEPRPARKLSVLIGATRLAAGAGLVRPVQEIQVHPDYQYGQRSEPLGPDVALLRLSEEVKHTDVRPVTLVRGSERSLWEPKDTAVVIGWGYTQHGGKRSADLNEVEIPIQPDDVMGSPKVYGPAFVSEREIGAGPLEGGRDSCQYDSGGPLLVKLEGGAYRLVGVVSWGAECAAAGKPGVYARLGDGPARTFIDQIVSRPES